MSQSKDMTVGAILPLLFNFTMPLLLGNLLQQTYSLVDAAIVGKFLGINALASVGASTSVVFLILGFCNGCCGGFGIPVAQKFGAHDYRTMRRLVAVSLKLAGIMSVAITLATCLLCSFILKWMQTPANIFEDAYYYLLITFIGIPCTFYYNLLSSILRALGDSKTPFWFLLFSTVLNILLDLLCIVVLKWGVAGAAIATVFSQGVSAVLCYFYMYRKFEILRTTPADRRFRPELARQLIYIGAPWDSSSRLRLSVALCFKVPTTHWVRRVWQPLRQQCVSRCSSFVCWKVWVLPWLPTVVRIMEPGNRSESGKE